jgi:hypothetical protein
MSMRTTRLKNCEERRRRAEEQHWGDAKQREQQLGNLREEKEREEVEQRSLVPKVPLL